MSTPVHLDDLPEAVVLLDRDGDELGRNAAADELLGTEPLVGVLTEPSWEKLTACFAQPRTGIEVVTRHGATWDAAVSVADGRVLVSLRDVSRYTTAAAKLTTLTRELAERQRDLQTLYDASEQLGTATDLAGIGERTCRLLCGYLGASRVRARLEGEVFSWPPGLPASEPDVRWPLSSAGEDDELDWWRTAPLTDAEQRLVGLLAHRVAVGLDRARLLARATHLANHDALTGLLNRTGAHRALATVAMPAALVLLDLDHFKRVNDEHGHDRGDRVLERFAEVLQHFRATDLAARWGGEEFLLVLPATTAREAEDPIDRLRRRVSEAVHVGEAPLTFTAGISDLRDPDDLEAALRRADRALYAGKAAGRDRVVLSTAG